jgi:ferredoxin
MKIQIDQARCQGHGRCYALAPELIEADELGNGREIGDGSVPRELEESARRAVLNCPERAVVIEEGS